MRRVISSCVVTGLLLAGWPSAALADDPVLTWSARTAMPTSRYLAAVSTTLDGDVIAFGGNSGGGVIGTVERFHPATNSWTTLAPMLTPRSNAGAATAVDGTILVVGGFPPGGDATNVVESYDPATDTWTPRAALPTNSAGAAVVRGADGIIYAIGGYPGCCFSYLTSVYAYDQVNNAWLARASMPTPRQSSGAALATDGRIYVVGGNGTGPSAYQAVEAYDPATNTWASKAQMPVGGSGVSLIAAPNGKLYGLGYDDLGTVLEYDIATDTWTEVEPLPTPRIRIAAALGGDGNIYAAGGYLQPTGQTTAVTERAAFDVTPAIAVYTVATATKATSTNQSIAATATVGVPAGDAVTVSVATGTFAGAVGCADTRGNAYTVVADRNNGSGRLFVCSGTAATALQPGDVITATYPKFSGLSVASVNAITGASVVDQTSTGSGNNPNPSSGSVTTTHATEVVFGAVAHNSVPTFTPGPGLTAVGAVTGGSGSGARTVTPEYMVVTTTGSYPATGTLSGAQQWRAAVVTFRSA